jgi:NADPH-dependent 2,4-dienoyl-CoA reductase/sulfur reductase-like enzyme/nitrite reductase/ring-hydroxylating ferredoxin subunit
MAQGDHDLGLLAEFPEGRVVAREVEGTPLLILREGGRVSAVGGECTHAGAPLAQGVVHDGRIICPWHKAAFCLRQGDVLDPPALDPLPRFAAWIENGHIRLKLTPEKPEAPPRAADARCFVIVGAGAAGAVAAQTLREEGFGGRIVMIDRENRVPYDRTILSKYVLSGEPGAEKSPLQTQAFYAEKEIERRTGEVTGIDAAGRQVHLAGGSSLAYDALLLATGGTPRRPDLPGVERAGVFVLRSRADADAILARAERSRHAVILGGSFIAMEVAASLRERGLAVTVVTKDLLPFVDRLGAPVGKAMMRLHEAHGVAFRLQSEAAAIEGEAGVSAVRLKSGERLDADLVVIGFGVAPATGYAGSLPRGEDGAILVNNQLAVAEAVFTAGDIASFPLHGDGPRVRVEHWRVAEQQGRVAARNMMGKRQVYDAVPVFWTIQYLKRLDYIGHVTDWDDLVVHGDIEKPEFLAYYVKGGRVTAAAGLDRDRDTAALVELMSLRRDWTATELGPDPARLLEGASPIGP